MSKRSRSAGPEARTTMLDSAFVEFKVHYEQTKHLAAGEAVRSDAISAGGHMWRINYYPRGIDKSGSIKHVSVMVELLCKSRSVQAIAEAFLMDGDGKPSMTAGRKPFFHTFSTRYDNCGWLCFLSHTDLVKHYLTKGHITLLCTIMVLNGSSVPVAPSDIQEHLGTLLDSTDGSDVSFTVDGETFHAHRAVLVARSPVFRAELLGSMAEATMPSITLHDITPATFKFMLRFMYTDALPGDDELGDSPTEMFEHLLAAADRYALDRLKLIYAQKLQDNVSVDTVVDALAYAEIYNCPELKNMCIDFVVAEKNFKKVVLTVRFHAVGAEVPIYYC